MKRNGITLLSPRPGSAKKSLRGFLYLKHCKGQPRKIEDQHLQAISNSNFLYVVNPTGYVGPSAALEVGYAISLGVPVFSSDTPTEEVLGTFIISGKKLPEIKRLISRAPQTGSLDMSIHSLQRSVARLTREKAFRESIAEKFI